MDHHHHHHHHGGHHHHHPEKTIGQNNQEHFDSFASSETSLIPWIKALNTQISAELRANIDWIGFKDQPHDVKMLDYACGDGLASRSLAEYFTQIQGIDISSAQVDRYNDLAIEEGHTAEKMHALHGDLLGTSPTAPAVPADIKDFDLVVMSMALHHVDDAQALINALVAKLRPNGVLLVVDWVDSKEAGCKEAGWMKDGPVGHCVSRQGFEGEEMKGVFERSGLGNWGWRWAKDRAAMPEEFGGQQQFFLARGQKI